MFLSVNTALIIVRATDRIIAINAIKDNPQDAALFLGVSVAGDPLKYLQAEACGQVASATVNFFLAILVGLAGTSEVHYGNELHALPKTA